MKHKLFLFSLFSLSAYCMDNRLISDTENSIDETQWSSTAATCAQLAAKGYRAHLPTFHQIDGTNYVIYQKDRDPYVRRNPLLKEQHYIILFHSPELKPEDKMIEDNRAYLEVITHEQLRNILYCLLTDTEYLPSAQEKKLLKNEIKEESIAWYLKKTIKQHKKIVTERYPQPSKLSQARDTLRRALSKN